MLKNANQNQSYKIRAGRNRHLDLRLRYPKQTVWGFETPSSEQPLEVQPSPAGFTSVGSKVYLEGSRGLPPCLEDRDSRRRRLLGCLLYTSDAADDSTEV